MGYASYTAKVKRRNNAAKGKDAKGLGRKTAARSFASSRGPSKGKKKGHEFDLAARSHAARSIR